ncbi:uncharacterized protein F4822DRAFT_82162 [Hypoxylon trugodes]|uniref:uncharacterized protein n=1 Tax=Hypoxylon trugodes TaxID=326681 RepID=UPI00219D1B6C|nr:uncharacterized protein F4822DRAFT_82162 [Hypoxylon trugodes]KAI1383590.1 hypothetical protein F4822DRAFT_82162 [Hypoxylon trugodes]
MESEQPRGRRESTTSNTSKGIAETDTAPEVTRSSSRNDAEEKEQKMREKHRKRALKALTGTSQRSKTPVKQPQPAASQATSTTSPTMAPNQQTEDSSTSGGDHSFSQSSTSGTTQPEYRGHRGRPRPPPLDLELVRQREVEPPLPTSSTSSSIGTGLPSPFIVSNARRLMPASPGLPPTYSTIDLVPASPSSSTTSSQRGRSPTRGAWSSDTPQKARTGTLTRALEKMEQKWDSGLQKAGFRPKPSFKVNSVMKTHTKDVAFKEFPSMGPTQSPAAPGVSPTSSLSSFFTNSTGLPTAFRDGRSAFFDDGREGSSSLEDRVARHNVREQQNIAPEFKLPQVRGNHPARTSSVPQAPSAPLEERLFGAGRGRARSSGPAYRTRDDDRRLLPSQSRRRARHSQDAVCPQDVAPEASSATVAEQSQARPQNRSLKHKKSSEKLRKDKID